MSKGEEMLAVRTGCSPLKPLQPAAPGGCYLSRALSPIVLSSARRSAPRVLSGRYCQVDEKLVDRPPRYWARASREPAMLGIRNGRQPQLDNTPNTPVAVRRYHPGAPHGVEHPQRDLSVVARFVSIDLAPEHAPTAGPRLADDDILAVQRVPWVQDPSNVRLMITAVGTSITNDAGTRRLARSVQRHLNDAQTKRAWILWKTAKDAVSHRLHTRCLFSMRKEQTRRNDQLNETVH